MTAIVHVCAGWEDIFKVCYSSMIQNRFAKISLDKLNSSFFFISWQNYQDGCWTSLFWLPIANDSFFAWVYRVLSSLITLMIFPHQRKCVHELAPPLDNLFLLNNLTKCHATWYIDFSATEIRWKASLVHNVISFCFNYRRKNQIRHWYAWENAKRSNVWPYSNRFVSKYQRID